MRLLSIFILFIVVEYIPRTFIESYKYHETGLLPEFLPLVIAAFISSLLFIKTIYHAHFGRTYFKLVGISIGGMLAAKTILFIQWYWFIAPEYRNVPGDMSEGFGWQVLFSIIGAIVISFTYLVAMSAIKAYREPKDIYSARNINRSKRCSC